jgi:hypothetical protein
MERQTIQLFRNPVGEEVLKYWLDEYVMIENLELDAAVEGARSFVIRLYEAVMNNDPDLEDEEEEEEEA